MIHRPSYAHAATLLVRRELAEQTRGSIFGWLWLLIQPLFLLAVYTLVFGKFLGVRFGASGTTGEFALYLFAALVPFVALQDGVMRGGNRLIDDPGSAKNLSVPAYLLPAVPVITTVVTEGAGLLVLVAWAVAERGQMTPWMLVLPFLVATRVMLTLTAALVLSVLSVAVRDLRHIVAMLLTVLFFATPIIYPAEMVPAEWGWLHTANPLYHLVEGYRDVILRGVPPSMPVLLLAVGLVPCLYAAYRFYCATESRIKDLL
ncbi:MAG: ABC transporter permease [Pseudomonadota bacterium]|nr:ABC transporter permease [Pseudomonadota bacterium]